MPSEASTDSGQTRRSGKARARRQAGLEAFRDLAQRIHTEDSEQRFEKALRTILNAKTEPKHET